MIKCPGCGEENPPKFRLCGYCGTQLAAAPAALPVREMRKTVTLLFSDLKDSTSLGERLDPEALHEVKERYFAAMAAEITRHGGKIEKFIGDAIMAVFGLPRAREDDALRAVRAAVGMSAALARLNRDLAVAYGVTLGIRTGVNTGEVVTHDDPTADQKLATGDAVNVAARLEQAAPVNAIYLGETTYRLVRDAVDVEALEPLQLKGKAEKVAAYRVVDARGLDGFVRRQDAPFVGRRQETAALTEDYRRVCAERRVQLVTIVGDAGLGKSRLVRDMMENAAAGARLLEGRCLPYGDGITFWPLVGMVWRAAGIREDDPPERARARLQTAVGDTAVTERLASAVGLSTGAFPLHETYWAARRFFEMMAAAAPLVALVDDIHWAEPAFLDLLEHVLDTATDAPVLLLATARPELLEHKPDWGARASSRRLMLAPLDDADAGQVARNVLGSAEVPEEVVWRVVATAGGNPLFVDQLLSMLIDQGMLRLDDGRWEQTGRLAELRVPPTIQALLEARLDSLERADRATVEPASVIGLEFTTDALAALAPDAVRPELGRHLGVLARKHFIRPQGAAQAAAPAAAYRFHNHLVREAVYNGQLKRARAHLHIAFVRWADKVNAGRDRELEFEEILAYHLEQAHRYLRELGPLDDAGLALGSDAARRLTGAARRAHARGDMHAAASLYRRAIALLGSDDPARIDLLPALGESLVSQGDFPGARAVLDEARDAARRNANRRVEASCQVIGMFIDLLSGQEGARAEETLNKVLALVPALEAAEADNELANAWRLVVLIHGIAGRYRLASEAVARSINHARLAGNERLVARNGLVLAVNALYGPMTVPQAIAQCEALVAGGLNDRQVEGKVLCTLAQLEAMNGDLTAARGLYRRGRTMLRQFGPSVNAASTGIDLAHAELRGGDLALAEREVRADYEFLAAMGERYFRSTMAALLARLVRDQGRDDEALALSKVAEEMTAPDDVESQALWRSVRAPILARAGGLQQAEELARAALDLVRPTEAPVMKADGLCELASVQRLAGKLAEARSAIDEAIALYTAKGDTASARRCSAWAADLART